MTDQNNTILDSELGSEWHGRRRDLLPWWIKMFTWIFLIISVFIPFALISGMLGYNFQLSLYGIETDEPVSIIGLSLTALMLLKGITAYGLWTEKDWAIEVGMIDATIGIIVSVFVMFGMHYIDERYGFMSPLRVELVLLIPFYIKLKRIKEKWA